MNVVITLRKMRHDDVNDGARILAAWNMAPEVASAARPDPECPRIPIENGFVALVDGVIVGIASYLDRGAGKGETTCLAVDPAWCDRGIGGLLQTARLAEMMAKGIRLVRTEADRPEAVQWYVRKFGYRIVGKAPKKHAFSLESVDEWTVLELDLAASS